MIQINKIRTLLLLQALFLLLSSGIAAQSIKDTKKFISYFNGIKNMTEYKTLKENIQSAGSKVVRSKSVSDSDKTVLQADYNLVKDKSDSLVDKLTADLLSTPERKKMVKDPESYVNSLNGIFDAIKTADSVFNNKFTDVFGATRGNAFAYQVTDFKLPLDNAFGDELITALLKSLISSQLKKVISLKSWDDLE
jgi:hypothetical protein